MPLRSILLLLLAAIAAPAALAQPATDPMDAADGPAQPLVIGDTFTLDSKVLGEVRRINVYRAPAYGAAADAPLPVLYMPDGGIGEDFLHLAGLLQISVLNGTMRPVMLVGIENTERRRDLTGPTDDPEDRRIAPRVGGSAAFRDFLRDELMPAIRKRYPTTGETAIVGESLAGLFVVETLLLEPALFDSYVAIDPSLWWNRHALLAQLDAQSEAGSDSSTRVFIASSDEPGLAGPAARFAASFRQSARSGLRVHLVPMPEERHATIYHPAALRAFRLLFAPAPASAAAAR